MKNKSADIFTNVPEFSHEEHLQETSPEEFHKIIQNRRSVRVYSNEKIPTDVVERVLEWGVWPLIHLTYSHGSFFGFKTLRKKQTLLRHVLTNLQLRLLKKLLFV